MDYPIRRIQTYDNSALFTVHIYNPYHHIHKDRNPVYFAHRTYDNMISKSFTGSSFVFVKRFHLCVIYSESWDIKVSPYCCNVRFSVEVGLIYFNFFFNVMILIKHNSLNKRLIRIIRLILRVTYKLLSYQST